MIEGVEIKQLKVHNDERGRLAELLRADEDIFVKFGQVYMTTAYPGVVKGWHYHKKQYDYFSCVKGMIKLVLFDARKDSNTKGAINEFFIGVHNPVLVRIPPEVYHGFKCVSDEEAIVINVITEPYNAEEPDEFRVDPYQNDIPYNWHRKDK